MPACPACGVATSPGPRCGACGAPLPTTASDLGPLRVVAGALLAVGVFIAASGLVLLGSNAWLVDAGAWEAVGFPSAVLAAGAVGIVAGASLLARQSWAWGLGVGLVAFGLVYAVAGLARGYASGVIGLAVWGALAYGLSRGDVRAPLESDA